MLIKQISLSDMEKMPMLMQDVLIKMAGQEALGLLEETVNFVEFTTKQSFGTPDIRLWEVGTEDILKLTDYNEDTVGWLENIEVVTVENGLVHIQVEALQLVDIGYQIELIGEQDEGAKV